MQFQMIIPDEVRHVLSTLQATGNSAELVGGCVRDALLGREPRDYDIATSAVPSRVLMAFQEQPETSVYPTGLKHGTVTVVHKGVPVEVTTYRTEGGYGDSRRPDWVEFSSELRDDVWRRDFTINALAWDGEKLVDHVGGHGALQSKIIEAVGHPWTRLQEDPLRMMRAIRLACQLGFGIDPITFGTIQGLAPEIQKISAERIQAELNKILLSNQAARGLQLLVDSGLMEQILPEVQRLVGFEQRNPRHDRDVFGHTLRVIEAVPPVLELRLAALLHDVGKPDTFSVGEDGVGHFYGHHMQGMEMAEEILTRLRYPNATIEKVKILVKDHMVRNPYLRPSNIKRMIRRIGEENIEDLFLLIIADVVAHAAPFVDDLAEVVKFREKTLEVLHAKEPLRVTDLAISGDDLIEMGLKPGPVFREVLGKLLDHVLEHPEDNNHGELYYRASFIAKEIENG